MLRKYQQRHWPPWVLSHRLLPWPPSDHLRLWLRLPPAHFPFVKTLMISMKRVVSHLSVKELPLLGVVR